MSIGDGSIIAGGGVGESVGTGSGGTADPGYPGRAWRPAPWSNPRPKVEMFSPKDPEETLVLAFYFGDLTDSVNTPVITAYVEAGVDPHPDQIILGSPEVQSDGVTVLQRVTGGLAGNNYMIRCRVKDYDGYDQYVIGKTLPVRNAGE